MASGRTAARVRGLLRPVRTALSSAELVRLPSGVRVTSPVRTLVDCATLLAPNALVCAADDALHRRLVTPQDLEDAVRARRGHAHCLALEAAVGLADGRAESPPETLARPLLPPHEPRSSDHATRRGAREADGRVPRRSCRPRWSTPASAGGQCSSPPGAGSTSSTSTPPALFGCTKLTRLPAVPVRGSW